MTKVNRPSKKRGGGERWRGGRPLRRHSAFWVDILASSRDTAPAAGSEEQFPPTDSGDRHPHPLFLLLLPSKCDKAGFLIDVLRVTSHFFFPLSPGQRELWAAIGVRKGSGTTRAAISATVISGMHYSARLRDLWGFQIIYTLKSVDRAIAGMSYRARR